MLTLPHAMRRVLLLAAVPAILCLWSPSDAYAVSSAVRMACRGDYTAYCAMHAIGSKEVRVCMRINRQRLSPRCRHALATSGEAKPAEVRRYERESGRKAR